jgi:hypothetical protein
MVNFTNTLNLSTHIGMDPYNFNLKLSVRLSYFHTQQPYLSLRTERQFRAKTSPLNVNCQFFSVPRRHSMDNGQRVWGMYRKQPPLPEIESLCHTPQPLFWGILIYRIQTLGPSTRALQPSGNRKGK